MRRAAAITAAVITVAMAPVAGQATAQAARQSHDPPPIGDRCLVGTWLDKMTTQEVLFRHHFVVVTSTGGDVDHIHASGIDHNNWNHAAPLTGTIDGDPLKEVVRGMNKLRYEPAGNGKAGDLTVTELGWSPGSSVTITYQGSTSAGKNQETGSGAASYRCSASRLTWLSPNGDVLGHEHRLSRKP